MFRDFGMRNQQDIATKMVKRWSSGPTPEFRDPFKGRLPWYRKSIVRWSKTCHENSLRFQVKPYGEESCTYIPKALYMLRTVKAVTHHHARTLQDTCILIHDFRDFGISGWNHSEHCMILEPRLEESVFVPIMDDHLNHLNQSFAILRTDRFLTNLMNFQLEFSLAPAWGPEVKLSISSNRRLSTRDMFNSLYSLKFCQIGELFLLLNIVEPCILNMPLPLTFLLLHVIAQCYRRRDPVDSSCNHGEKPTLER